MMDEKELFERYHATGDVRLRNEIVEKYLYIASVLAKKFVGRGVDYDDLYQIASLALVKGVDRFDETKGLKFSTFITPTITGEIKNYFRDRSRLVHLPRRISELRGALKKESETFFAANGRSPSPRELSELLGASEEEIVRAMEAGNVVSLDRPAETSEGSSLDLYEALPAETDDFDRIETHEAILSACKSLDERERELLRLRFGKELSQTEAAKRMNVSQMYVSRMERRVLEKLRETLKKSTEA